MITTTYKCDKCGHEQPTADQMWTVAFTFKSAEDWSSTQPAKAKEELWCRACLEKLHVLSQHSAKEVDIPTQPPTLEEMIRQIVREELPQ